MKNPVHPGEVVFHDVLEALELSVAATARRLGVSRIALSRMLRGHARMTPQKSLLTFSHFNRWPDL